MWMFQGEFLESAIEGECGRGSCNIVCSVVGNKALFGEILGGNTKALFL